MKKLLAGLLALSSISAFAQNLSGRELIELGTTTNATPTELKTCSSIAEKYASTTKKLEKIRSSNASVLSEQVKLEISEGIDEISAKHQKSLEDGAFNRKCNFSISSRVEELLSLKVEHLTVVTKNSPSLSWAKEFIEEACMASRGVLIGEPSCEKNRDGYSIRNQHGGQTNVLPDFECSQVCKVNLSP